MLDVMEKTHLGSVGRGTRMNRLRYEEVNRKANVRFKIKYEEKYEYKDNHIKTFSGMDAEVYIPYFCLVFH